VAAKAAQRSTRDSPDGNPARKYTTFRLYSVYGPWEDERRLIPTLIDGGLRGELPALVSVDIARDYVYADDVVDASLRVPAVAGIERGDTFNIDAGTQTTIRQIVDLARAVLGIEQDPRWGTMPDRSWDTGVSVADPTKAEALGWRATRDLESGFRGTFEWMATR
jgi:nucleoside-diphosphate-sugar epimerase